MKTYKWNYDDGLFNFSGTFKFFNGFNAVKLSQSKCFKNAFHRTYPGKKISELNAIKLECISFE